jgi:CDP-diacylglycerol pyrophosphatase
MGVWLIATAGALAAMRGHQRDALRRIVQEQCVPGFLQHGNPQPCETVVLSGAADDAGYAILHDRKGQGHFLLIPTRTLGGIESAALLAPTAPDYVAAAWRHRDVLEHWFHHPLPRDAVGLAINPRLARGQDQLHIHIECVGLSLHQALTGLADTIGTHWTSLNLLGRRFQARIILGDGFEHANPVQLMAGELRNSPPDLGPYTLIVAGWTFRSGPGVIVLVATGRPGGETLLDATCAVAAPHA